ncbi:MAG: ImmA/IrrE family metallo-endopeptidase [Candidatus Sulfotelmatobacter sp.]
MPNLNPTVLSWARATAGLNLDDAARAIDLKEAYGKSGADRLAEIEAGQEVPSRSLVLRMAKEYRRSLLVFYMAEPPRTGDRGDDFRTVPGAEPPLYNPLLDALIRDIRGRQNILKSGLEDADTERLTFIGSANTNVSVEALAQRIARELDFRLDDFRAQPGIGDAFDYLRFKIESGGIFVLLLGNLGSHHTNISVDTFRGYAIADDMAPLILINDQDARSAWSFTALHEVAHLWLGASGVSGWADGSQIERYCNDVASEILLPERENRDLARIRAGSLDELIDGVSAYARSRRVSRPMVTYRLYRLGVIDERRWNQLSARFKQEWLASREREAIERRGKEGGPSYYVVKRHKLGDALVNFVTRSLGEGLLSYTKAGRVLGVKARNVNPLLFLAPPKRGDR